MYSWFRLLLLIIIQQNCRGLCFLVNDFLFYFEVISSCVPVLLHSLTVLTTVSLALPCSQCLVVVFFLVCIKACVVPYSSSVCLFSFPASVPVSIPDASLFCIYLLYFSLPVLFCCLLFGLQIYSSSLFGFLPVCLEPIWILELFVATKIFIGRQDVIKQNGWFSWHNNKCIKRDTRLRQWLSINNSQ